MQLIPRHDPYLVVRSTGGLTVAALRGELDLVLVRHLRPELDALVRESDALTVDIRRLSFCDATGLGLLAHCAGRVHRRGARWRLLCDQPWILRLIRLTVLTDVLHPEPGPPDFLDEPDPVVGLPAPLGGSAPLGQPDPAARPEPVVGLPRPVAQPVVPPGPMVPLPPGPGVTRPLS
ncbi:STAS domain-containing protein [Streptomyces sp. TLI_105]|uniref:STAS domain-containing protein n=1 Tax=Streptomyces sp. TLI_105 TaxID=1881019 RepID=UPI00089D7D8E|nr:STAS domain-containing protein [Streptomyces sp. TLI_105]SED86487.1 anti-sigma B factor antagonist [Streptomyces sp. TLI_105]